MKKMSQREQREKGRLRNNATTIVSIVLLAVAAVVAGYMVSVNKAQDKLDTEIASAALAFQSGDGEWVNDVLGRVVGDGEYGKVEEGLKKYIRNIVDNAQKIKEVDENNLILKVLDADYLAENRNRLDEVKAELEQLKQQADENLANVERLYSEEGAITFVPEDLNNGFRKLFLEDASGFYDNSSMKENYTEMAADDVKALQMEIEAVDFLSHHMADWSIKNEKLTFTNSATEDAYNAILESVAE